MFAPRRHRPLAAELAARHLEQPQPPNTALGVAGWFAAFQKPVWEKRVAIKVAALFALIALGQTVALVVESNNSGPKPYFVEHDERSGAVWVSDRYAEQYNATAANKRYFLVKWATRVFTIEADGRTRSTGKFRPPPAGPQVQPRKNLKPTSRRPIRSPSAW